MALQSSIRSISCKILGHGACKCTPTMFSTVRYCQPSLSTISIPKKPSTHLRIPSRSLNTTPSNPLNTGASAKLSTIRLNSCQSNSSKDDATEELQPLAFKDKIKLMWKAYGIIAVGTYLGVYIGTLSSIFLALDFDIFSAGTFGLDPAYAIHKFCDLFEMMTGNTALPSYIRDHPRVGTFAIAWVMTKFTEPLRLGFTVGIVPSIGRLFGKTSYMNLTHAAMDANSKKAEEEKKQEEESAAKK